MLTPFDDYPLHQAPVPVTQPMSGDPNHYDRYFFNGYEPDGSVFFGGAMGHYPNRSTVDAAFSVVHDGVQHSVFASGRMSPDRGVTSVGPVSIVVEEPLRRIRLVVEAADRGLECDVVFDARTVALEEPRQSIVDRGRLVMDYTRLTQWGSWAGSVRVHGTEVTLDPSTALGTRDRSWGVRPVGAPPPMPPSDRMPQIFWLWAPLNFEDVATHLALFEHSDGRRWMQSGSVLPVLDAGQPTWGAEDDGVVPAEQLGYRLEWEPGTRRAQRAGLSFAPQGDDPWEVELDPLLTFRMRGIGYTHPEWGHGGWRGELEVGSESIAVGDFDPGDPTTVHIQELVRARVGDRVGIGVLEQLVFGDHEPTGLTGVFDGAPE